MVKWHHFSTDHSATRWQIDYIEPLSPWKGQCIVLTGVDICPVYGFVFAACNPSAKITIYGLIKHLIHHHDILYSIDSDQGTPFTVRELQRWTKIMESNGLTLLSMILKLPA